MYILHAHWQPPTSSSATGTLHFWAETALAPQPPKYKRNTKRILPHPFCVEAKTLRQILLPADRCHCKTAKRNRRSVAADDPQWSPTVAGAPARLDIRWTQQSGTGPLAD
ncbi:MAG: hypothetical protein R2867_30185 [Caldilineaceae bacterium]